MTEAMVATQGSSRGLCRALLQGQGSDFLKTGQVPGHDFRHSCQFPGTANPGAPWGVCSRAPKDRPRLSGDKATYMSGVPVSDGICSCPSSIRPCSSPVHPSICFLPCSLPDTNQSPVLAASGGQSARAPGEGRKRGHSLRLERARWQAPRPGPFGDGHLTP